MTRVNSWADGWHRLGAVDAARDPKSAAAIQPPKCKGDWLAVQFGS